MEFRKYFIGKNRKYTLSLLSVLLLAFFYVYICYLFNIPEKMKSEEKLKSYSDEINHDKTMMKLGMAIYRNQIQIYKGNERKADSAYYANYEDILLSIYKESLQIPTE